MQIVINISEESYKFARECKFKGSSRYDWGLSHDKIVLMIANGTPIPDNATNGDIIKAMFPNAKTWEVTRDDIHCAFIDFKDICEIKSFPLSWWNAPYKGVEE